MPISTNAATASRARWAFMLGYLTVLRAEVVAHQVALIGRKRKPRGRK